jgi:cardiolipin synthase
MRTPDFSAAPVFLGGNGVALMQGGDELFPALIAAIDAAQHEVWLATYIFYTDDAARGIAESLAAAARRGVKVKVTIDGFGSHNTLSTVSAWLEPHGVELMVFRPLTRWWNWLQPGQMRRLHQKICVVDSRLAFVGGINLIDDRNDLSHGRDDAPRLDFAVSLTGPVVVPIEQTVRAVWTRASLGQGWRHEVLQLARSAEPVQAAWRLLRRLRILPAERSGPGSDLPVCVAFLVRDNLRQRRTIERALIAAIRHARVRVDLVTPYFYPGRAFRLALTGAARRGVRVRLLLQGKVDYHLAGLAARVLYHELLAGGVEIHEYTPAFLHAKMALADDDWVTVGSSNIDPLSLLLNLEANVVVADPDFSRAASVAFEAALEVSQRIMVSPLPPGLAAFFGRALVSWIAHWYLRIAGLSERY